MIDANALGIRTADADAVPRPSAGGLSRKRVTALFADIVDSARLASGSDPELLANVLDRYFATAYDCVADNGGNVEKFIGDAVVALFGVPVAGADDAANAVRAAAAIIEGCDALNAEFRALYGIGVGVRIGVCSGQAAVTVFPNGSVRVVGPVVTIAARLQAAAPPGGVLIDAETARLVRGGAVLRAVDPVRAKGVTEPVAAWSLVSVGERRSAATPFVGRRSQLARLARAHQETVSSGGGGLVAVIGQPGLGKTRLIEEFAGGLGSGTLVLRAPCSPQRPGATYEPIRRLVEDAAARVAEGDSRLAVDPDDPAHRRAAGVLTALARGGAGAAVGAGVEEIAWAVRSIVTVIARRAPLVVLVDDVDCSEPVLADLVRQLSTVPAPVLVACSARPGWIEGAPGWPHAAEVIELDRLDAAQSTRMIAGLLDRDPVPGPDGRAAHVERIRAACDGSPLFIELMCQAVAEGQDPASMPDDVATLLDLHLNRLTPTELDLLHRCATIGRTFTRAHVDRLARDVLSESAVADGLAQLCRRRFIEPAESPGLRYRFCQELVREAAYRRSPKALRAQWHNELADALGSQSTVVRGGDDEAVIGEHREAAFHLQRVLRPATPSTEALGREAAAALASLGTRALRRRDLSAAAGTLRRARACLPARDPGHDRLAILISDALVGLGRRQEAFAELPARSASGGDLLIEVQRLLLTLRLGVEPPEAVRARAAELGDAAEASGDAWLLSRHRQLEAFLQVADERLDAAAEAFTLAAQSARAAGDDYEADRLMTGPCELSLWNSTPVSSGLRLCAETARRLAADRVLLVPVDLAAAGLLALQGRLARAQRRIDAVRDGARELGLELAAAVTAQVAGLVQLLGGDQEGAAATFAGGCRDLLHVGQPRAAQTLAVQRARVLFDLGRFTEAREALGGLDAGAMRSDVRTDLLGRALAMRLALLDGRRAEAVAGAVAIIRRGERTCDPVLRGDVLWDCARVLSGVGRHDAAQSIALRASSCYELKEAAMHRQRLTEWIGSRAR